MHDAVKSQNAGGARQEPKDPRDRPIETSNPPTDPIVDPLANGSTKPPYGGPEGGGGREKN